MKKKLAELIISFFLLFTILFLLLSIILRNLKNYQKKFDSEKLANIYNQSQFVKNPKDRKSFIADHDLYAYAGWHYLKTGKLNSINIEHPPLGKYLIGLSVFIFDNQNIGQIFWGILFLFLLYKLSFKVLKHKPFALLVVLFFCQEKLFQNQLSYSLLELPLAVFLLMFLLLIQAKNKKNKKWFLMLKGVILGAISSIKYPTTALVAFITLISFYYIKKEVGVAKKLFVIGLTGFAVFLLAYLPFFMRNPHLSSFYNLQLKALKIHLSHVPEYPKGQVFNVLFFNRWLAWWGEKSYLKTDFWNFLWPILTINFFVSLFRFKKNLLINLWTLFYLLFLSSRLFFPRYLFTILPFFYLQLCYNLERIING